MELELKKISNYPIINDCDLRECSVHYRYEDSDNLISLFGKLMKFNMISELMKAKLLLEILPKLLKISTKAVQHKNMEESKKSEQQRNDIIAKFDGVIEMIIIQPGCTQKHKDKFAEMREKIKTLFCK